MPRAERILDRIARPACRAGAHVAPTTARQATMAAAMEGLEAGWYKCSGIRILRECLTADTAWHAMQEEVDTGCRVMSVRSQQVVTPISMVCD